MGAVTYVSDFLYNAWTLLRNQILRLRRPQPLYALLDLSGPYPEHRTGRFRWIRQPQSIDDLREQLKQIAGSDAAGVVLTMSSLQAGLASVQSMRAALAGLRRAGKRVVAYVPEADMRTYYLASAADTIVMPEAGALDIAGLRAEMTFFKDALDRLGVAGAFEQMGEYKGAAEPFTRGAMSEAVRESLSAVLDSTFAEAIAETAEARGIEPAALRAAVDRAPLSAAEARSAGLVDGILFEDELPRFLQTPPRLPPVILPWTLARRRLQKPLRWRAGERVIAMIGVRGIIQMGESRNRPPLPIPFLGGSWSGIRCSPASSSPSTRREDRPWPRTSSGARCRASTGRNLWSPILETWPDPVGTTLQSVPAGSSPKPRPSPDRSGSSAANSRCAAWPPGSG